MTLHVEMSWIFRGPWNTGQGLVSLEFEQGEMLQVADWGLGRQDV